MKLTDDRNGLKITKSKRFRAIKGDTCDFFNRRTVANIRRTEYAVMDCSQWLLCLSFDSLRDIFMHHLIVNDVALVDLLQNVQCMSRVLHCVLDEKWI